MPPCPPSVPAGEVLRERKTKLLVSPVMTETANPAPRSPPGGSGTAWPRHQAPGPGAPARPQPGEPAPRSIFRQWQQGQGTTASTNTPRNRRARSQAVMAMAPAPVPYCPLRRERRLGPVRRGGLLPAVTCASPFVAARKGRPPADGHEPPVGGACRGTTVKASPSRPWRATASGGRRRSARPMTGNAPSGVHDGQPVPGRCDGGAGGDSAIVRLAEPPGHVAGAATTAPNPRRRQEATRRRPGRSMINLSASRSYLPWPGSVLNCPLWDHPWARSPEDRPAPSCLTSCTATPHHNNGRRAYPGPDW
jgi:hypothetical protein